MFYSMYKIKIEGRDVKRFIKKLLSSNIYIEDIEIYDKYAYIKVNKENYEKLKKIKTIYKIELIRLYGIARLFDIIRRYSVFIIALFIGYLYLIFLSNIIFKVEIVHSKKEIRNLINKELKYYEIEKYHFVKSYKEKEKIEEKILNDHKDTLEWLEIERIGTKYEIRVEERVIKNPSKEQEVRNIVAAKSGIITKIQASKGEIIKKIGDYVRKGDIIISGLIKKDENVKNKVSATGSVYAEVWYKTNIDMPYYYKEENETGNSKITMKFSFLKNDFYIFNFNKYKTYKEKKMLYLKNAFLPISFSISKEKETIKKEFLYSPEEAVKEAKNLSDLKIKSRLNDEEHIISSKILSSKENENYVNVEVFYKIIENITDTGKIIEEKTKEE